MLPILAFTSALILLSSKTADAAEGLTEPSYNYVSLEYELANDHQGSRSMTYGFCFEPVKNFNRLHVFGGWQDSHLDLPMGAVGSRKGYLVGGGLKHYLTESTTVHARAGYVDSETKIKGLRIPVPEGFPSETPYITLPTLSVSATGRYLEVGARTILKPRWELVGFASHVDAGGFIRKFLWLTLEYRAFDNWGVNISAKVQDGEGDAVIFATRYHF